MGKDVTPCSCQPTGCPRCYSPIEITMPENQVRVASPNVAIFQCPECGQLVLDDAVGWKGSGLVAHVTEDDIANYLPASLELADLVTRGFLVSDGRPGRLAGYCISG